MAEALDAAGAEGLFVKNLENVQGDERDVILFSTAFSVNDKGVLPLNFGPLNRAGGERRLNVAVTRARRQVVIFSSFEPAQLRVRGDHVRGHQAPAGLPGAGGLGRPGVGAGRAHGPARTGTGRTWRRRCATADTSCARTSGCPTSEWTSSWRDRRSRAGRIAAVLLDGPEWGARQTIGDRDALPLEVLGEMLRWPVVSRVWLPTWLADRAKALDDLEASFAGVVAAPEPLAVGLLSRATAAPTAPEAPSVLAARSRKSAMRRTSLTTSGLVFWGTRRRLGIRT